MKVKKHKPNPQKYAIDAKRDGKWFRVQLPPMSDHAAFAWICFSVSPKAAQYDMIKLVRL